MNVTVATGTAPNNGDSYTINPAPGAAAAMAVATTNPDDIAAADPYVATPGTLTATGTITDKNYGTITAGTDTVTPTPPTDTTDDRHRVERLFSQPLTVTFTSGGGYTDSLAATATPTRPATAGMQVATGQLTGTDGTLAAPSRCSIPAPSRPPAIGSCRSPARRRPAIQLALTPGGSSSGSNATRMAALWTASGTSTDGTLQQGVIGFTTGLGSNADEAATLATGTGAQVTAATTNLQNISGVNSDQQAVLLVNYQQAYQAVAQVISTAHTMFQTLLSDTAA